MSLTLNRTRWGKKMIRSVHFDKRDIDIVSDIARRKRTSVSAVIREAVVEYIKKMDSTNASTSAKQ